MKKVELNIAEWREEYKSSRKQQNKYTEDEFVIHMIDKFIDDLKAKITKLAEAKKNIQKKSLKTSSNQL